MFSKTKIALIAALAVGIASPAFAQSFSTSYGTGNELPSAFGSDGKLASTAVAPRNEQIATRQIGSRQVAVRQNSRTQVAGVRGSGLYDYAAVPFTSQRDPSSNSPALTGGGSTGYNQMVLQY